MTSGEWDLRALRALEEEELKQFRAISEPELFKIPPPAQLPTIDEFCGLGGSSGSGFGGSNSEFDKTYGIRDDPIIPLPPSIFTKSSLSSKLLGSPTKGLKKNCNISGSGVGGGGNNKNFNSFNHFTTLTRSATLNRNRKLTKQQQQQQQHQFHCKKNLALNAGLQQPAKTLITSKQKSNSVTSATSNSSSNNCPSPLSSISSSTTTTASQLSSALSGGIGVGGESSLSGCSGSSSTTVVPPSSTLDQANEMMTMMMFLSSTAPPELNSAASIGDGGSSSGGDGSGHHGSANTGGGTLSTFMMCASKRAEDDADGIVTYSSINRVIKKNSANKNLLTAGIGGSGNLTLGRIPNHCNVHNKEKLSTLHSTGDIDYGGHHVPGICPIAIATANNCNIDYELEDHIKHCSCSCNHMGYGNSMDYQTTGFGGLPDVTEHSNIKRTTSHQDSVTNTEFVAAEISSLQKSSKKSLKSNRSSTSSASVTASKVKRKRFCLFSLTLLTGLIACAAIATIFVYQLVFLTPSRNSHDERLKIVKKILNEVPLIDGHNDLAWNVRKYAHSSLELLDLKHNDIDHKTIWHRPSWSQTDITRLKEGLVGAQIWSAYVPCDAQGLDAVQLALEQIDIIHRFTELHSTETILVISSQEIIQAHSRGLMASLIGIEGGHALGSSLGVLRSFHSLGARYLTLAHQCDTTWSGSSSMSMDKGLTSFGKSVIKEMNRLGMLIDLSHSSDVTAKDVLEVTRAPVIFSHSVARALCNSTRNVPDDILRAVADNGGLIMISFDSEFITCSDRSTLHDVVAHIKYIRSIAGIEHIGIGAGYDGIERPPIGLEDVSKYPNLFATLLEDSSWSEEDLAKLAGKNFIRVLKSVENVRDYWKRAAIQPVETSEPIKKSQCTYMSSS